MAVYQAGPGRAGFRTILPYWDVNVNNMILYVNHCGKIFCLLHARWITTCMSTFNLLKLIKIVNCKLCCMSILWVHVDIVKLHATIIIMYVEINYRACMPIRPRNINWQDWKYTSFVVFARYSQNIRRHNAICIWGHRWKHWIESPILKLIFNPFTFTSILDFIIK